MKPNELPEKYQNCDWLWNYGSIGLTREHIKRLNNAINILESLNEHTDAKSLKEIKDKLLEVSPDPKIVKFNTDAFIEKACEWLSKSSNYNEGFIYPSHNGVIDAFVNNFKNYMKRE